MIHLHSMLSPETNTTTAGQHSGTALSQSLSQSKLDSFHGALAEAVSSTLQKFGIHSSAVNISITPVTPVTRPQDTSTSQTSAGSASGSSITSGTAGSASGTSASTGNGSEVTDPFRTDNNTDPSGSTSSGSTSSSSTSSTASSSTSTSSTQSNTTSLTAQQTFDNAYWAAQPPAVQALRNIQDSGERTAMATQLASEGYSIDVPIMVWGWDPSITMNMRQADGYTWVPSALQNGVDVAPGLGSVGSLAAYDPNNPPAGAIMVS